MDSNPILLYGFCAIVLVAAAIVTGGIVLRVFLPVASPLREALSWPRLKDAAIWIVARTELWTLTMMVGGFVIITLLYS